MAENDVLSLNLFYDEWCKNRLRDGKAPRDIQPFEYFIGEQFLKRHSLNDDELLSGLVGTHDDGGIDAFYFFINKVVADDTTVVDRRSVNDIDVILMQIRESSGFSPTSLEKMDRFTDDLLDLSRESKNYRYNYHSRLQGLMSVFKSKMSAMSQRSMRIEHYFVTRCDEAPNDNCERAAKTIRDTVLRHFPEAEVPPFNFAGPQRIYDETAIRKPTKKIITLPHSIQTPEGWVGIVPLRNYYEFLTDEKSPDSLNETIFDDNVRGYYQNTPVNRAITTTLENPENQPEFWLLNNGITVLTPKIGLKSGSLELQDPQIVNGLQTSRRIFEYFKNGNHVPNDQRRIVIRIIENDNEEVRDQVIRATNNQNKMAAEALISTSRLHKQLDQYFADNHLFYDRRKGHYKDQGEDASKIISIITLIQAVVTIILKKPHDARGRPRDYVTDDAKRSQVFGPDDYDKSAKGLFRKKPLDLQVYLRCVQILRRVDAFIANLKLEAIEQRNVRFYLIRYAACSLTGNAYSPPGFMKDKYVDDLSDEELSKGLDIVRTVYMRHGGDDDAAKGKLMNADFDRVLITKFSPPHKQEGRRMSVTSQEYERFEASMKQVLSVSKAEILRRESEYQKQAAVNPNKRGPKRKN